MIINYSNICSVDLINIAGTKHTSYSYKQSWKFKSCINIFQGNIEFFNHQSDITAGYFDVTAVYQAYLFSVSPII